MKSDQSKRRRISSQLVGSTTMKKMAKVIVGKSMGGGQSRASASRNSLDRPDPPGSCGRAPRWPGSARQPIWYTSVTSTDTDCEPGFTGGVGAAAAPGAGRAPAAYVGGPTG